MAIYVVQIGTNKIQMKTNEINKTKRYPTRISSCVLIQKKYKLNTNEIQI